MIFLQQETVSIPTAMKHITLLIIITALTLFIIAASAVYMLFSKKRKQSGKEKEILAQLAQVTDPIKGMMEAEKDPRQKALYRQLYGNCMNIRNLICGDTDPATESIVQTPAVKEEETAVEQVTETPAEPVKDIPAKGINFRFDEIKMTDSSDKLVAKVIDVIHKNMENSDFTVEDLSREIGMSRVHLNRKLKELMNISPSNLIKSIRLKQAAFLLINNDVNISEVAYKVGFSTHSYFSNSFHDYFGMTPKDFVSRYIDCKDEETLKRIFQ